MFERRHPRSTRMAALEWLRQLHLVAYQDHVFGAHAHCDRIGERHLSCLIDEQVIKLLVQFLSREKPSGPGDQIMSTLGCFGVVGRILDDRAIQNWKPGRNSN